MEPCYQIGICVCCVPGRKMWSYVVVLGQLELSFWNVVSILATDTVESYTKIGTILFYQILVNGTLIFSTTTPKIIFQCIEEMI